MLGAFTSALCVGALAERVGWGAGFALAAGGMALSWLLFVSRPIRGLDLHSCGAHASGIGFASSHSSKLAIAILCLFLPIVTIGWVQFQGLWLLEAARWCHRTFGSFVVPVSWLLGVNGVGLVLLIPLATRLWMRALRPEIAGRFVPKFVAGCVLIGLANLVMAAGFRDPAPHEVSLWWPTFAVVLITAGEAIFWPSSYNVLYKLAPLRLKSFIMGLWLAMMGVGQFFAHQIARTAETVGFTTLSVAIGAVLLLAALGLCVAARLNRSLLRA